MFGIGPFEFVLLALAAIMLFGGDLPDALRKAGRAMGRLRGAASDLSRQIHDDEPPREDDRDG